MPDWWGLAILLVALLTVGAGAAAGTTGTVGVQLDPGTSSIENGSMTTLDLVVTNTEGGVGAFDISISITDNSVVGIENHTVSGNPALANAEYQNDNTSLRVTASGLNTIDRGEVTIVQVTIRGTHVGTTQVNMSVTALGNESGDRYDIGEVRPATVSVESESGTSPTPTSTTTPTTTPTATNTRTERPPDTATETPTSTASPTRTETVTETETRTLSAQTTTVGPATETAANRSETAGTSTVSATDTNSVSTAVETSTQTTVTQSPSAVPPSPRTTAPEAAQPPDNSDGPLPTGMPLWTLLGILVVAVILGSMIWYLR